MKLVVIVKTRMGSIKLIKNLSLLFNKQDMETKNYKYD
tara:strand:- start:3749 stop:3862 length:114 start_codon:yes stop_codon:yes gene_type:complete